MLFKGDAAAEVVNEVEGAVFGACEVTAAGSGHFPKLGFLTTVAGEEEEEVDDDPFGDPGEAAASSFLGHEGAFVGTGVEVAAGSGVLPKEGFLASPGFWGATSGPDGDVNSAFWGVTGVTDATVSYLTGAADAGGPASFGGAENFAIFFFHQNFFISRQLPKITNK